MICAIYAACFTSKSRSKQLSNNLRYVIFCTRRFYVHFRPMNHQRYFAAASRLNPDAAEFTPPYARNHFRGDTNVQRSETRQIGNKDNDNLKATLSDHLWNETYECMICCDRIRRTHPIWSCQQCYCIFHLRCIKKWAVSCGDSKQEESQRASSGNDWRCPGCQSINNGIPHDYKCFCGKTRNPNNSQSYHRHLVPHTCGELCQKLRNAAVDCSHTCNDPCHPGPCDPCPLTKNKACLCGKESRTVRCGTENFQCGQHCEKLLNCGIHRCQQTCHAGECSKCEEPINQECFCGRSHRQMLCGQSENDRYSCDIVCNKLQSCGTHRCARICHDDDCGRCVFDPEIVDTCCCGKMGIEALGIERKSCTDPLPVCGNVCGKQLDCGQEGQAHHCGSTCHPGDCPTCPLSRQVSCRCGSTTKDIPCIEAVQYNADHPLLCNRRCTKKRSCKQHKCGELCCVDSEHLCTLICGRKLSCGIHNCEALCHSGKCRRCLQSSFEELTCYCGTSIIYPPVPCGTKPPACSQQCTRQHACQHQVTHTCHSEPDCPPCTFLTEKYCYGKHELRKNIPCYLTDVSCGLACGQPLPCGQHTCIRQCHPGECVSDGEKCNQPCMRPKPSCGHPCATKCHADEECPEEMCKFMVTVTCPCGHNRTTMACYDIDRLLISHSPTKLEPSNESGPGNSNENTGNRYKCLQCTEECARIERNRRFAAALEIQTGDFEGESGPPSYTDFLKEQAKDHPEVVLGVEKVFNDLVIAVEKSSEGGRNYSFAPSNRNHRRLIHEYAAYWDIDTVAYDREPKRNVVARANKSNTMDKWPPTFVDGFHVPESVRLMEYRKLGATDMFVSKMGLGGGPFGDGYRSMAQSMVDSIVSESIRNGINFVDTAYYYGQGVSEKRLGQALKPIPRSAYYICTKIGRYEKDHKKMFDFSAERTQRQIDQALDRLGLPYLDILHIHDVEFCENEDVIVNETLPVLLKAKESGKVRYIGITGYCLDTLKSIVEKSKVPIDVVLSYCRSTLHDSALRYYIPYFRSKNIGVINAAAVSLGMLTNNGPLSSAVAPDSLKAACRAAAEFCQQQNIDIAKLATYYSMNFPGVATTLVGMDDPSLVARNLQTCWGYLSADETRCLNEITRKYFQTDQNWVGIEKETIKEKLKAEGSTWT